MIKESKYCSDMMKKYFNKELVMSVEDNEDFQNSTKCWICDNVYVDGNVKVRDHCYVTEKYGGSAHRDCNIKKFLLYFTSPPKIDPHLVMQKLGKFNLKINVIPNGLEKYMSYYQ